MACKNGWLKQVAVSVVVPEQEAERAYSTATQKTARPASSYSGPRQRLVGSAPRQRDDSTVANLGDTSLGSIDFDREARTTVAATVRLCLHILLVVKHGGFVVGSLGIGSQGLPLRRNPPGALLVGQQQVAWRLIQIPTVARWPKRPTRRQTVQDSRRPLEGGRHCGAYPRAFMHSFVNSTRFSAMTMPSPTAVPSRVDSLCFELVLLR